MSVKNTQKDIKQNKEKRNHNFTITLTDKEYLSLTQQAKTLGLSYPDYIMRLHRHRKFVVFDNSENLVSEIAFLTSAVSVMIKEVNRIGVLINQTVKLCNSYRVVDDGDIKKLLKHMENVNEITSDMRFACKGVTNVFTEFLKQVKRAEK